MSPALPTPDSDIGLWDDKLNEFIRVTHKEDGHLKDDVINVKDAPYNAVGADSGNETAAFTAAIAACPAGGKILIPKGIYRVDVGSLVTTKAIQFIGQGKFSSVLKARTSTSANPVLDLALNTSSVIWNYYGSAVRDLGIDTALAANATGLRIGVNTHWVNIDRVAILAGTSNNGTGLENRGANNNISDCLIADFKICIFVDGDTGSELRIERTNTARNITGTTEHALKVTCQDNTANKGAIRLNGLVHQSGTGGGIQTNAGWLFQSDFPTSMPVFAERCEIDNITGGGAGIEVINCHDFNFDNGWVNCGFSGRAMKFNGVNTITVTDSRLKGNGTYELVTWPGGSFVSSGNELPSNPVYTIPTTAPPFPSMFLNDHIVSPGVLDVSNDMARLKQARAPRLGTRYFADETSVMGKTTFAAGLSNLASGQVIIGNAKIKAATTSVDSIERRTPAGTLGLILEVVSIVDGSVTIRSLNADRTQATGDTSTIYVSLSNTE